MIKLAIFDMDGTVFESYLDWKNIKKNLGLDNKNILKEIYHNNRIDYQRLHILEQYEKENTLKTKPIAGIKSFLDFLRSISGTLALTTNNNRENTRYLLYKFQLDFDTVITREMKLWKPDPDAFLYLMDTHNCQAHETISIGDSHYDIEASKNAEIANIFIKNSNSLKIDDQNNVVYFNDYFELKRIIQSKIFQ